MMEPDDAERARQEWSVFPVFNKKHSYMHEFTAEHTAIAAIAI